MYTLRFNDNTPLSNAFPMGKKNLRGLKKTCKKMLMETVMAGCLSLVKQIKNEQILLKARSIKREGIKVHTAPRIDLRNLEMNVKNDCKYFLKRNTICVN